ncbi:MAG: Mfa1 fimbrilin C-terminal domain-containing protein [Paraprevotella sp.]|nr:Mfa1 fimbrilin C-terminal domain-containing protein [Paraprevotella sp.]
MKTKSFIAMSMIAALAAGCSSDDIVDGVEDTNGGTEVTTSGTAFVSLNIMLPNTAGTRADATFEQGDPDEYKVNSLEITFYSTVDGSPIQTVQYTASDLYWEKPASSANGITTKAVLPVVEVKFKGKAKALAVINKPNGWTVGSENNAQTNVTASTITGVGKKNFFMTNTVKKDGTYLVDVESFTSKDEAQKKGEGCNIYVERAVAKVNLYVDKVNNTTDWSTENIYTIPENQTNTGAKIKIANWQLDVTNTTMYPIRNFTGTYDYREDVYGRFFDSRDEYRTYWAKDPNYDTDGTFNTIKFGENIKNGVGDCEYCLENTFDVKHQKQNQTTRALVKAIYTPKGMEANKTWYTLGNSAKELSATDVQNKIAEELKTDDSTPTIVLNAEMAVGTRFFTTTSFTVNGSNASDDQVKQVNSRFGKITTYKDGVCYYAIRIKHLDGDCPWGDEAKAPTYDNTKYVNYVTSTSTELPGPGVSYLGRYGVVRNNWYKVTINRVLQPGSPIIPELTEEPDDEQKYYLQATINIQDWAVRNQGVDL